MNIFANFVTIKHTFQSIFFKELNFKILKMSNTTFRFKKRTQISKTMMNEEEFELNYKDYDVKFTKNYREIWERNHPTE